MLRARFADFEAADLRRFPSCHANTFAAISSFEVLSIHNQNSNMEKTKGLFRSTTIWAQIAQVLIGLLIFFSDNFLPEVQFDYNQVIGALTTIFGSLGILGRKAAKRRIKGIFKVFIFAMLTAPLSLSAQLDAEQFLPVPKSVQKEQARTSVFCLHSIESASELEAIGFELEPVADINADRQRLLSEYNLPASYTDQQLVDALPNFHSALYRTFSITCDTKRDRVKCERYLRKNGLAEYIERPVINFPVSYQGIRFVSDDKYEELLPASLANDPGLSQMYAFQKNNVVGVWSDYPATRGAGQRVLIVDTPPRFSHLDIRNRLARKADGSVLAFEPYSDTEGIHEFQHFHGGHVGGTVMAEGANNVATVGITPESEWLQSSGLQKGGFGFSHKITSAIVWASDQGFDVGNHSYGPGLSQSLADAMALCHSRGQLNFVAAGNENKLLTDPLHIATLPTVFGVAALDRNDLLASFSNRSVELDLAQYGSNILSTGVLNDTHMQAASGTSMASPHAAAVFNACNALAKQERGTGLTFQEIEQIIDLSGKKVANTDETTPPLVLMDAAIEATLKVIDGNPAPPPSPEPGPKPDPQPEPEPDQPAWAEVQFVSVQYSKASGWRANFQYRHNDIFYIVSEVFDDENRFRVFVEEARSAMRRLYFIQSRRFLFTQ